MSKPSQIFAKQLRHNMTEAEKLLWYHLRGHRLNGAKFKRQQPLGDYIVDFVSFEKRLVIEVDGGQHLESVSDKRRDAWLHDQGFNVLRFWNNEVLEQTEAVLEKVLQLITPSDGTTSHLTNPAKDAGQVIGYPPPLSREGRGDKELDRARWRCRRGLLELDIVLERFVGGHYATLNEAQRRVFDALLDMPDNSLWDMITGRAERGVQQAVPGEQQELLEKIRAA